MAGKFIVLEGVDGAGLTTQTNLLANWLSNQNEYVVATSEPTRGMIGGLVRSRIAGNWSSSMRALRLLMAADTIHHTETAIEPSLNQGKTVICDRYIMSALAYGLVDSSRDWMETVIRGHRKPDAIFYLRVTPVTAIKRLGKKGFSLELFERESYLRKVSENYDILSKDFDNVYTFDGEKKINEVHGDIKKAYKKIFK